MIHTLFQIFVFQVLFLAVYDLFLKKETFFNLNRLYLLIAPILGFILPFVSLGFIQHRIPQEYIIQLPAVVIGGGVSEMVSSGNNWWIPNFTALWIFNLQLI